MTAVSTWRMNGLWRKMTVVLVLCTLLLSNNVICQDASTAGPGTPATGTGPAIAATDAPVFTAATAAGDSAAAPSGNSAAPSTQGDVLLTTAGPKTIVENIDADSSLAVLERVVDVKCVAKDEISEDKAVKAVTATDDCEKTKEVFENNAPLWCFSGGCSIKIFQEGTNMLVDSPGADLAPLVAAIQSDGLKQQLGLTKGEVPSSSSNSTVFATVLVTGLLAALGLTIGYFKCPRRSGDKAVRLAEEAYPVDQETQASTLASAAPLNPPPETEEKPTENSDSTEPAKTEPAPPPTNGHSTPKTADTEL